MNNSVNINDLLQQPSEIIKIVFFGPESTGKSTLCKTLAERFGTVCNPEYMRDYLQKKWDLYRKTCEPGDILPIARGQIENENKYTKRASGVLFSDTDLLELVVYSEVYYGKADELLLEAALKNRYDLYFLTYIDVPWEKDDLRDKPFERKEMFEKFKATLEKYNRPYIVLKGDKNKRLHKAAQIIETMLETGIKLTEEDVKTLKIRNITVEEVLRQAAAIKNGKLYRKTVRPATIGDGIIQLDESAGQAALQNFNRMGNTHSFVKFVPASGAATRMFKDLFIVLNAYKNGRTDWNEIITSNGLERLENFEQWKTKLAFYEQVIENIYRDYPEYDRMDEGEKNLLFVKYTLTDKGLNYISYPKALIGFHRYPDEVRTAFEEHLKELKSLDTTVDLNIRFTVAPEKEELFTREERKLKSKYNIPVTYSYQSPSTDTVMLDENNRLVRDDDGRILFRPGGHGSLLENLNALDADYIFIKNIDNVQKNGYKEQTLRYIKILTGLLHQIKTARDRLLLFLEEKKPSKNELDEVENFITRTLGQKLIEGYYGLPASQRRTYLAFKLNRPVRIAGMVKNTGQPGGGPFWISDEHGNESLQIVEKSEINLSDETQRNIFENSTHFNPVFLAVSIKNHRNEKYDLKKFANANAAFVSEKIQAGKKIKIYEHPGLWNGSMEHWISIFVEVPVEVFSPVKEFYDLTRPPHI